MLHRLIIANAVYYSSLSTYCVEYLLLTYAFYSFYASSTYCVERLLLRIMLNSLCFFIVAHSCVFYIIYCIPAYAFNFLIICLFCTNCIFNSCIAQSMLLSLFGANMAYAIYFLLAVWSLNNIFSPWFYTITSLTKEVSK